MDVGITTIELNQRLDLQAHEISLELALMVMPDTDGHFMERVQHAILVRDPQMLLLTLLEGCSGHAYVKGESLEPGERTRNDPRYQAIQGMRAINVGD